MRNWFLYRWKCPFVESLPIYTVVKMGTSDTSSTSDITCCRTWPKRRSQYIFCSHKQSSLLYGSFFRKLKPWTLQLFSLVRRIDRQAAAAEALRLAGASRNQQQLSRAKVWECQTSKLTKWKGEESSRRASSHYFYFRLMQISLGTLLKISCLLGTWLQCEWAFFWSSA